MKSHEQPIKKPKVIIIGGSLGGLFVANILWRGGWEVEVLERTSTSLSARGAGIVTHPELFDVLSAAGVPIDHQIGVHIQQRVTLDQHGNITAEYEYPQTLTAWSKMYEILRASFPNEKYFHDIQVDQAFTDSSSQQAIVVLANGEQKSADLVIAADGLNSTIRQQYLPESQLQYVGYIAWRGVVDEQDLSQKTQDEIFERFAFCLPSGEQILGYPVAGQNNSLEKGQRRYNFVWYRPVNSDQLSDLLTDQQGITHQHGIPPHLIRPSIIDDLNHAADHVLAPQFAEIIHKTQQLVMQPIYDLTVEKLVFGRVALLGDAAFVARPHCGMGVTKAAADAMKLGESLKKTSSIEDALHEYEQERLEFGHFIVNHARHLGFYMQAQLKSKHEQEIAEQNRSAEAVMTQTAVPPRLK